MFSYFLLISLMIMLPVSLFNPSKLIFFLYEDTVEICLRFEFFSFKVFIQLFYNTFSSVQSVSCVQLFATPWIAACLASLSISNSWSSPKLMCIESGMPSNHLILCHPLLLLPPILPSIRAFSNESTLHMRWPMYWSFSFSIIPS